MSVWYSCALVLPCTNRHTMLRVYKHGDISFRRCCRCRRCSATMSANGQRYVMFALVHSFLWIFRVGPDFVDEKYGIRSTHLNVDNFNLHVHFIPWKKSTEKYGFFFICCILIWFHDWRALPKWANFKIVFRTHKFGKCFDLLPVFTTPQRAQRVQLKLLI